NAGLGQAGLYIVTVTDANSCSSTDTTEVVVLANPIVQAFSADTLLCFGDPTILIALGTADIYTWLPADGLNTTMGDTVLANPIDSITYVLTGIDNTTGCQSTDTILIQVFDLPLVEAGPDTFVCAGADLQLGGSPPGGTWTDAAGMVIPNSIYNQPIPGTYTLYYDYSDGNECSNVDSLEVCVLSNPIADFSLDMTTVCTGTTIAATNLSNVLGDCQAAEFHWSVQFEAADCHQDSTGWFFASGGPNSVDASFGFTLSGVYTITLTVHNVCDTVATSQVVEVGAAPEVVIDPLPLLCADFEVQPTADILACNSPIDSILWTFSGAVSPTTSTQLVPGTVVYPGPGVFIMTLTIGNACGVTTDSYTFEIFDLPEVTASNNGPLCEGEDLQLTAGAPTGVSYQWSGPNGFV
ncbi:MAG: hypothetical protein KDC44_25015, partial [Phaeodactylibacter sp.]|nr:hypothetical protein [Phaeodactylibacter sp.]